MLNGEAYFKLFQKYLAARADISGRTTLYKWKFILHVLFMKEK